MSDQLQEAEYALKQEKKKREHESTLKDTRLKEQEKYYEQQIKGIVKYILYFKAIFCRTKQNNNSKN